MKSLNITKGFKKVHEDEHHVTMAHKDGHQIKISKKALSPDMRGALAALPVSAETQSEKMVNKSMQAGASPKQEAQSQALQVAATPVSMMAKGGDVSTDPTGGQTLDVDVNKLQGGSPISPQTQAMIQQMQANQTQANAATDPNAINYDKIASDPNNQPYMTPDDRAQSQPPLQQPNMTPQGTDGTPTLGQAAQSDPWGTQAYLDQVQKANGEMEHGLTGQARAEAAMGQQQAADIKKNLDVQQQQQATYQQNLGDLTQEYHNFQSDVQNQHIDANHYLNSMGTAGKIKTAIGLILGGFGVYGSHGVNPAMSFLQNQIDRDVNAQQANLGKSENLLNANLKQFGNMRDASDMTRVMQMGIVENQLKEAAAKAQGPLAASRANQALADWHQRMAPIMSQIAMRRTLLGAGSAGHVAPETLIRMVVPEGQQNETMKSLKEAQDTTAFHDNLLGAFDKLATMNTVGNALQAPLQTSRQVHAIKDPLTASLSKGTAGRFTEQDAGMLESLWPAKGDNADTIAQKRAQMTKIAEEKMHFPQLTQWGIDPRNFGRYQQGTGMKRIQLGKPVRQ